MNTRVSLYQARYGSPEVTVPNAGSALIDQLLAHRSVRAYLPDPVSDDTLGDIGVYVRMAQRVRSHGGWPGVPNDCKEQGA